MRATKHMGGYIWVTQWLEIVSTLSQYFSILRSPLLTFDACSVMHRDTSTNQLCDHFFQGFRQRPTLEREGRCQTTSVRHLWTIWQWASRAPCPIHPMWSCRTTSGRPPGGERSRAAQRTPEQKAFAPGRQCTWSPGQRSPAEPLLAPCTGAAPCLSFATFSETPLVSCETPRWSLSLPETLLIISGSPAQEAAGMGMEVVGQQLQQ